MDRNDTVKLLYETETDWSSRYVGDVSELHAVHASTTVCKK